MYRTLTSSIALAIVLAQPAVARDTCRLRTFDEIGCSTSLGLKTAVTATNASQLQSVGCVRITDKPEVTVIDRFSDATKVTITTAREIIPIWVRSFAVDCSSAAQRDTGRISPPSPYSQTADGFVWKDGKRIGWVDPLTSTYYRLDQLALGASGDPPSIHQNSSGQRISTNLDAAVTAADQAANTPPGELLHRTADGFVWFQGKRIGWVDQASSKFYRLDQLDLRRDLPPSSKAGANGYPIVNGDLAKAVVAAGGPN